MEKWSEEQQQVSGVGVQVRGRFQVSGQTEVSAKPLAAERPVKSMKDTW